MVFSGEYPIPSAIKEGKAGNKNELNLGEEKKNKKKKKERYLKTDFTIKNQS